MEDSVRLKKVKNFPSTDNSFVNYVTIKWSITGSESTYLGPDLPPAIGCKLIIWPLDFLQEQLSILEQEYELWKQPAIIKNCSVASAKFLTVPIFSIYVKAWEQMNKWQRTHRFITWCVLGKQRFSQQGESANLRDFFSYGNSPVVFQHGILLECLWLLQQFNNGWAMTAWLSRGWRTRQGKCLIWWGAVREVMCTVHGY